MKVAALLALLIVCVVVGTHARADSALLTSTANSVTISVRVES